MNNEIENQKVINTKLSKMLITTGFERILPEYLSVNQRKEPKKRIM